MSNIVIETIVNLLHNYREIIYSRYVGDAEFEEFKIFLRWKRCFGFSVNLILIILSVILFIYSFKIIKLNVLRGFILGFTFSLELVISYGLIIFSLANIIELCKTKKHFLIKNINKIKDINWSTWHFKEIIFKEPEILIKEKKLIINIGKNPKYFLYLICKYPEGQMGWFGVNNWNTFPSKNPQINDENVERVYSEEKEKFRKKEHIEISHKFILEKMLRYSSKSSYQKLYPVAIVGIRIRANVENRCIKIKSIENK